MKTEDIDKKLFASDSSKYGDAYIDHLLEQYKIYVSAAEKISDRRQKSNEFFLALNTALVTLLGLSVSQSWLEVTPVIAFATPIAGMAICYFWFEIIRSHKNLNDAKYRVLHVVEQRLPMALYDTEWELLERGKNNNKYWAFTHIELNVPWVFILLYVTIIFSMLYSS